MSALIMGGGGRRSLRGAARRRCGDVCATMLDHRAYTGAPNRSHRSYAYTRIYTRMYVRAYFAIVALVRPLRRRLERELTYNTGYIARSGAQFDANERFLRRVVSACGRDRAQSRRDAGPVYRGHDVRRAVAPVVQCRSRRHLPTISLNDHPEQLWINFQ